MIVRFPMLFKATSTGAIQQWEIRVEGNRIITEFGQVDGKLQQTEDVIKTGKNSGKANATTPETQAALEAEAKHVKMKKKGYVEALSRAHAKEDDLEGIKPMLAHKYSEQAEKIVFPAAVQPKLDGIRCLTRTDGTLWSRSQKPIVSVPHINEELRAIFGDQAPNLDGELYSHEYRDNFEHIISIVAQKKQVDPNHRDVEYHVYDVAIPGMAFADRQRFLIEALAGHRGAIRLVETAVVNSHDELMSQFHAFRSLGYEGAMVRNLASPYEGKRSYHLQKVKEFDEAEFPIIGVKEGRGRLAGCAIFVCQIPHNPMETVDVKLEGEVEALRKYLTDESLWKGRKLTVQFQGFTNKNQAPRFPVGLRIREEGF